MDSKDMSPMNGGRDSSFEKIKRLDESGIEYWSARELFKLLGYSEYGKFINAINKAIDACNLSGAKEKDHFARVSDMINIGKGAQREVSNFFLSRYACYLIAQNGDSRKEEIANAQTYFAIQTRKQEVLESLDEEQRRLYLRGELKSHNSKLAAAAKDAGVIQPIDYAIFQDKGYKGLYNGLGAKAIHYKKRLKDKAPILDHMGSTELAANLFRATQTEDKLRRDNIEGKERANQTHYEVGKKVRKAIQDIGGTMPEDLPVAEDIKKVERKHKKQLSKSKE